MEQTKDPPPVDKNDRTVIDDLALLHQKALQAGALTKKSKELIALAVSVASGARSSIAYHLHNALEAGAGRDEIAEAVDVAMMTLSEPHAGNTRQIICALDLDLAAETAEHPFTS